MLLQNVLGTINSYAISILLGTSGSIAVCISPLTSLMMDQRAKYSVKGLHTEFIAEAQTDPAIKCKVLNGDFQLLFITPESIIDNATYRNMLLTPPYKQKLIAVVIDEAHCVKVWGDQFRTTFAQIGDLRSLIPDTVKIMALTATATTETLRVVTHRLSMIMANVIPLPPFRDHISYEVHPKIDTDRFTSLICTELAAKRTNYPKTIIYVRAYTDCSTIYMLLKHKMGAAFSGDVLSTFNIGEEGSSTGIIFREWRKTSPCNCHYSIWNGHRLP